MKASLPASWKAALAAELDADYFGELGAFVDAERSKHVVLPAEEHVFAAFEATPLDEVRVLLLGQDPYPTPGNAHGLSFSVLPGVKPPASLMNMFKELESDVGCAVPGTGYLMPWAKQGILMLNTVLTVQSGKANSHRGRGWERFTDAVIASVNAKSEPIVFVLWGNAAKAKASLIDQNRHAIVQGAHPSPLAASLWFGSKPFSRTNQALLGFGGTPIDWSL